jgi:hypothetical protein
MSASSGCPSTLSRIQNDPASRRTSITATSNLYVRRHCFAAVTCFSPLPGSRRVSVYRSSKHSRPVFRWWRPTSPVSGGLQQPLRSWCPLVIPPRSHRPRGRSWKIQNDGDTTGQPVSRWRRATHRGGLQTQRRRLSAGSHRVSGAGTDAGSPSDSLSHHIGAGRGRIEPSLGRRTNRPRASFSQGMWMTT